MGFYLHTCVSGNYVAIYCNVKVCRPIDCLNTETITVLLREVPFN